MIRPWGGVSGCISWGIQVSSMSNSFLKWSTMPLPTKQNGQMKSENMVSLIGMARPLGNVFSTLRMALEK
ncbi:hypothetical protein DWB63_12785 [Pseudodesulfovibrio sp. S3]|nr:hypothetical protein DWB63_12785 [Pseudodesulfovibrio sp. S3]